MTGPFLIPRARPSLATLACTLAVMMASGCHDDSAAIRRMQTSRQAKLQGTSEVDHLREASELIAKLDELADDSAADQINYHLNAWQQNQEASSTWQPSRLLDTLPSLMPESEALKVTSQPRFQDSDLEHFRLNYLLRQVTEWAQQRPLLDPLVPARVAAESDRLDEAGQRQLKLACRLFDWVVRNVQLEPSDPPEEIAAGLSLPDGLVFQGPGYRQTTMQTLWRGTGDWLQRADLFLQLCRHGGLDGCLLALPADETAPPKEWMAAVRIDGKLFLFAPQFGIPVPGPGERGIATLAEARNDESVLRRLRVPGVFDYSFDQASIQQVVALLVATPEMLSDRMHRLQEALTGGNRMRLYLDADALADKLDAVSGVVGVRLWRVPLLARRYERLVMKEIEQSVQLSGWYFANFAFMQRGSDLYLARWNHLAGNFETDEATLDEPGARVRYMELRLPEFELEDLQIDVELQKEYGIRRELGDTPESYARKVQSMQLIFRQAKRAATFWLGLLHVEDGRWEPARTWMEERVLGDPAAIRWHSGARYNLARTLEHLGDYEKAIALYKTNGDPQEHGNRIRARLVEYAQEQAKPEAEEKRGDEAEEQPDEEATEKPAGETAA